MNALLGGAVAPHSPSGDVTTPLRAADLDRLRDAVLAWGADRRRDLPWRATRDPWLILVSEVMLQQTQVSRVLERWPRFVERYPTPKACADAPLADVLAEWQGMGYPRRARNLHRAARVIEEAGMFPSDLEGLLELPGVGPYTARAVLAFAYEADAAVVDTNVGRILARLAGQPLAAKRSQQLADDLLPVGRAWEWNQTVMDVGSQHCRPTPGCDGCPMSDHCRWAMARAAETHGAETHGAETDGAETDGAETEGAETDGAETEGAETDGAETHRDSAHHRGVPDPAAMSAHVSKPQARFEGSDRQARGRLLAQLSRGPVATGEVADIMNRSTERADALVRALIAEGLVSRVDDQLHLGS